MEQIQKLLYKKQLIYAVLSNRRKNSTPVGKITVVPFVSDGAMLYQFSYYDEKQVRHQNVAAVEEAADILQQCLADYKNLSLFTDLADYQILIGKKGNLHITEGKPTKTFQYKQHNKQKQYILTEGTPYLFLQELGIMTADGKVKAQKYKKFVQINKYLEIVRDSVKSLPQDRQLTVIDFGCGKSYLTFALYYYLVHIKQLDVQVIGVDLKQQVIEDCREVAKKLGFAGMRFVCGDIREFDGVKEVDMVVSLHACDTATDAALKKAVEWNSKVIIAVPCCQHELFTQIENPLFEPVTRYGILKDKMATIVTDTLRGLALEVNGYQVQVMEFTSLEHTAKNVLIRAEYTGKPNQDAKEKYQALKAFWQVTPSIDILVK